MRTVKVNTKVGLNGKSYDTVAKAWIVKGWEKNGMIMTDTKCFDVVEIDGMNCLEFFMKDSVSYFEICKLAREANPEYQQYN